MIARDLSMIQPDGRAGKHTKFKSLQDIQARHGP